MGYKLYDKCVGCRSLGINCDGPRTSSVEDLERWCELMRAFKEWRGFTNEYIAEESGVSLTTVAKIMSGNVEKDIRWNTVRNIEKILIGPGGQYPCPLAAQDPDATTKSIELKDAQLKHLETVLSGIHESYQAEIAKVRDDAERDKEEDHNMIKFLMGEITKRDRLIETRGREIERLLDLAGKS